MMSLSSNNFASRRSYFYASASQSCFLSDQVIKYVLAFQSHCFCEFNIFSRKDVGAGSSIWLSSQRDIQRCFIAFAEGRRWAL